MCDRITSYNVCYTKLLRSCTAPRPRGWPKRQLRPPDYHKGVITSYSIHYTKLYEERQGRRREPVQAPAVREQEAEEETQQLRQPRATRRKAAYLGTPGGGPRRRAGRWPVADRDGQCHCQRTVRQLASLFRRRSRDFTPTNWALYSEANDPDLQGWLAQGRNNFV